LLLSTPKNDNLFMDTPLQLTNHARFILFLRYNDRCPSGQEN
jgi:hypothetical protein